MCTVSYIATLTGAIITSNRDEHVLRAALPPQKYIYNNKTLLFPKDLLSGGTWYATDGIGKVLVLLNGGAKKHAHLPPYRRSRGLIVLDLISVEDTISEWESIDLNEVEPFTIVLFSKNELHQLQWSGKDKSKLTLDASKNHIWSSSTLYAANIRTQRAEWFTKFVEKEVPLSPKKMFDFHRYTENSDATNGLVISRNKVLKTLSITQTIFNSTSVKMHYHDLISEKNYTVSNDESI
jgi:uncharacterized protein with NRDE domain